MLGNSSVAPSPSRDDVVEQIREDSLRSLKKTLQSPHTKGLSPSLRDNGYRRRGVTMNAASSFEISKSERFARAFAWSTLYDSATRTVNPHSIVMHYWDLVMAVLLVYTALVTPYEVGFLETRIDILFAINRVVDTGFIMDTVLQFYLPFVDNRGTVCKSRKAIAKHYVQTWFVIDIISLLPFDIITVVANKDGSESSNLSAFKIVRIVRLLRILKLLRILRGLRVVKKWETKLAINYALLHVCVLLLFLILMAHWYACIWGLTLDLESDDDENWFSNFPWLEDSDMAAFTRYTTCLYWSCGLLTAMFSFEMANETEVERRVYIVLMIFSGIMNAFLVGGVVSMMERMHEKGKKFYKNMDTLNNFIQAKRMNQAYITLPGGETLRGQEFCERLRQFYIFQHRHGGNDEWKNITESCSPFMQSSVARNMHANILRNVFFFRCASDRLVTYLSTKCVSQAYTSRDYIVMQSDQSENLFLVERGAVLINGSRFVGSGNYFGAEVFYTAPGTVTNYTAYCLVDTVVLTLHRDVLKDAIATYENFKFRTRIKFITNLTFLVRGIRKAATYVIHTLDVHGGARVLSNLFGGYETVMIPENPLIGAWKRQCLALMSKESETSAYPEAICRLKKMNKIRQTKSKRRIDRENSKKYASPAKKRWKMAFAKVSNMLTATKPLTPMQVIIRQFHKLERTRKFVGHVVLFHRRHERALREFVKQQFQVRSECKAIFELLHDKHKLTLPLLRQATTGELVAIGVPLADAMRLVATIRHYPLMDVDRETMSLFESPELNEGWERKEADSGESRAGSPKKVLFEDPDVKL
eukprot:g227.t1